MGRMATDVGGTFTDLVQFDEDSGQVVIAKALTTPADPSQGVVDVIGLSRVDPGGVTYFAHGGTTVINAITERKGVRTALVTTAGFRDVLEIGRGNRPDLYNLTFHSPAPFVPRALRFEVRERIAADGTVLEPLNAGDVADVARALAAEQVEAVAIMFLHSFAWPAHEAECARLLRQHLPDLAITPSHEVTREWREYERSNTAVLNACVQPIVERYFTRLEGRLDEIGLHCPLLAMQSNGGTTAFAQARAHPITLIESGPAGGVIGAAIVGQAAGEANVISLDIGGTTAKCSLIENGAPKVTTEYHLERTRLFPGYPVKVPVIDIVEIGAGGGSIAALDEVGLLKVGPHSAGSDPGPACYGMGGTEPTVTDANLVLGYYDPAWFLGGRMRLDIDAARAAVARVAEPLGLSVEEAALGIHKVVVEGMAAAARVHLVERGNDPRHYAMVGFGGAGPAHAADVARVMGIAEVIVPPASGAASALGFLAAPLSHEAVRSLRIELAEGFDAEALNRLLEELEAEGRRELASAGVADADMTVERSADMRLVGQMHEIAVPLPAGRLEAAALPAIRDAFLAAYSARYSKPFAGARFEAVNFRIRVAGPVPELSLSGAVGGGDAGAKVKGRRTAWFEGGPQETAVWDRYALRPGDSIPGPAIIEEREATTVIGPQDAVTVDAGLNLCIRVGAGTAARALVTAGMSRAQAVAAIEADPIGLEIMWARLVNVVEEMWHTVCRTAFSLVIAESQDFACELLDKDGETLAHSPRAMPVFNLTLPRAVKALLERYPAETLQPGDVLITNDPWLCAGHLFDIAIVTPCFRDGRLVGLMGTVGHVSDIGGTKDALKAREIYEEGLQIPPMKLYEAGRPNETLLRLIAQNVRGGEQVLGDVHSFIAANEIGAERLCAFMDDYGMEDLGALAEVVQGLSERAMRSAIRAIPDGTYRSTISNNPLGQRLEYPVKITVAGEAMEIDFDGAPPQLPQGGLNSTLNYTAAHATYPLKCMLTPAVRGNAGCYRPFTVKAPEGSILNPTYPASVNIRTRTGWYIAPNIFAALAGAAPAQVQAFTGLGVAATVYGRDASGRFYADMLFCGGGQGGSARGDGHSALLWPTSAAGTSIELMESRAPILVLEKTFLPDTGGPGQHRGGLSQRVRFRKRLDDGQVTLVSVYPEGVNNPIHGLFGGLPGGGARGRVLDADHALVHDCGTGQLVELTGPEQIVELTLAGGSGYGDPARRDPARLARDIALGFVTPDHALAAYGHGGDHPTPAPTGLAWAK